MLELLVRLECKRQALIKRRLLQNLGSGPAYWGIAAFIFFVSLFPALVDPALAPVDMAAAVTGVGSLLMIGFILCATIVAAPAGLVVL